MPNTPETLPAQQAAVDAPDILAQQCTVEEGFLHYKKWWFRREVELSVNGERIAGTPIFLHGAMMRVANPAYSYFIPLSKVDYIRTRDGLEDG